MLKGALIGFAVALAMLLPPIIHWVSGPLGPLVGGFIGGSRARASGWRALGVGLLMGLFMILPIVVILLVMSSVAESLIPGGVRKILGIIAAVIVLYTGFMGSIGAAIGGHQALKQGARQDSAGLSVMEKPRP